jgi:predicted secreted protein
LGNWMHWVVLAGAYVILWFLALQILLPIGIRTPHESGEEAHALADAGAPSNPRIVLKALIASGVAAVLWLTFYALVLMGYINV